MSTDRLSLQEICNQIALTALLPPDTRFGTSFDRDYVDTIKSMTPKTQIWVVGQRLRSKDDGMGYPGLVRQTQRVEVVVRALFQRYDDGNVSGEAMAQLIHKAVADQLIGWTPTNANRPLVWMEEKDGLAVETVPTLDMVFTTELDYSKAL